MKIEPIEVYVPREITEDDAKWNGRLRIFPCITERGNVASFFDFDLKRLDGFKILELKTGYFLQQEELEALNVDFLEWVSESGYLSGRNESGVFWIKGLSRLTTKELYKLYLKQT